MNRKNHFVLFSILVAVAVITRSLPYLFHFDALFFQPVMAMGIFSITIFKKDKAAILVPLLAMLVGDLVIEMVKPGTGFYPGQAINYLFLALAVSLSYFFRASHSVQVTAAAVAVPLAYYLLSNAAMVFISNDGGYPPMYTKDMNGLMNSYVAGFPFFLKDIVSTALFSALFFGVYRNLVAKGYIRAWA